MPPSKVWPALLLAAGVSLTGVGGAPRAETWFDAGSPDTTIVFAPGDSTCWERFPPACMGPLPERSYVAETISFHPCTELRWPGQVCGREGLFVQGFRLFFNDGGCGCGGYVESNLPTTLHLPYDPAMVAAAGLQAEELRLVYNDERTPGWRLVPEFRVDTGGRAIVAQIRGKILGLREYAIVGPAFVPVAPTSWSWLKTWPGPGAVATPPGAPQRGLSPRR